MNADEAGFGLSQFSLRGTILSDSCPADPVCDEDTVRSPFRTMDGSCNNLVRTAWGKSNTQVQRGLVAVYADGIYITTYKRKFEKIYDINFDIVITIPFPRYYVRSNYAYSEFFFFFKRCLVTQSRC